MTEFAASPRPSPLAACPPTRFGWLVPVWIVLLTLVLIGPLLVPGFVLRLDMVFTPEQSLLPWMLGVDGGLPRAAPQDAVVAVLTTVVPGEILQKVVLLAIPLVAGFGVWRLLRQQPVVVGLIAVSLAIWSPFVAQRLLIGHWALLLGFAATPWVLLGLKRFRAGDVAAVGGLLLWLALGSLVPTTSLFMMLLVVPLALTAKLAWRWRLCVALAPIAYATTWVVPAITSVVQRPADGASSAVFDINPQAWGGPLLAALGGAGIWNTDATLPSGALFWAPLVGLGFVALAVAGFARAAAILGRGVAIWLGALALSGLVAAVGLSLVARADWWVQVQSQVVAFGLLRDSQKLLLPLVVLVAICAPLGFWELMTRIGARRAIGAAGVVLALVPLAAMPDFAFGAFGRLSASQYPDAWEEVRTQIAAGEPGEAVSVPWRTFRRYPWNESQVVLDPSPRYMTTTVVTDDSLAVGVGSGRTAVVAGDNPRSAQVRAALDSAVPYAASLAPSGVRWVIEQTDQPQPVASQKLAGLELVYAGGGLRLWQVPGVAVGASPGIPVAVVGANVLAVLVFAAGSLGCGISRLRSVRFRREV